MRSPPEPYVSSPSNDEFLCSILPKIKATGNLVQIRVVDLSGEGHIALAVSEYAPS